MHLHPNSLARLSSAAVTGFDPFGIGKDRARSVIYHEDDPAFISLAADTLRHLARPDAAERLALLASLSGIRLGLEAHDVHVLRSVGIDPLGLLAAYHASCETGVTEFSIDRVSPHADQNVFASPLVTAVAIDDDEYPHLHVALAPTLDWRHDAVLVTGLNETAAAAMAGMELRQAVSHASIDPLPLMVDHVESVALSSVSHVVHLQRQAEWLDAAALHERFPPLG